MANQMDQLLTEIVSETYAFAGELPLNAILRLEPNRKDSTSFSVLKRIVVRPYELKREPELIGDPFAEMQFNVHVARLLQELQIQDQQVSNDHFEFLILSIDAEQHVEFEFNYDHQISVDDKFDAWRKSLA